jgi:hypothetical protein
LRIAKTWLIPLIEVADQLPFLLGNSFHMFYSYTIMLFTHIYAIKNNLLVQPVWVSFFLTNGCQVYNETIAE